MVLPSRARSPWKGKRECERECGASRPLLGDCSDLDRGVSGRARVCLHGGPLLRGSEDVAAESRALVRALEMDTTRAHAARLPCVAKAPSRPIRRITRKVRILRASDGDRTPSTASEGMRKTMADLSAILGEEDEQDAIVEAIGSKEEKEEQVTPTTIEVSESVIQALRDAEEARGNKLSDEAIEQMRKILDTTKEMSKRGETVTKGDGEEKLEKEFDSLSDLLKPKSVVPKEDVQLMKDKVFGPTTFWVTGTLPNPDLEGGVLFRGNLRDDKEVVFKELDQKTKDVFNGKYELFMSEDFEAEDVDARGTVRVRFLMVPSEAAQPIGVTRWQILVCVVLAGLTVGSAFQLGIGANINRLPPDVVAYFLNPQNLDGGTSMPKLEDLDLGPVIEGATPIMRAVLACAGAHEIGHFVVGALRGVKLSPPYFIPNGQIGTFGAITQFKSLINNRKDMFDVAIAGPMAGGSVALVLFAYGLINSIGGDASNPDLISIPTALFNSSFLLGTLSHAVLGGQAFEAKDILIHPMLIAGWCALTTTALNCLPVGSLDGGRVVQSAWGRRGINISSLLTYAGLGFGIIGGNLSLSWGLFILICQRVPEKFVKDSVTGVDSKRSGIAWIMVILALLILFPQSLTIPQDQGIFI